MLDTFDGILDSTAVPTRGKVPKPREVALYQLAEASFDPERRLANVALVNSGGRGSLAKEDDQGDVEYKWRLTSVTPSRLEHLITQMRFRVGAGNGQCLYELGITDDGFPKGLPFSDYQQSVMTLLRMAKALDLDTTILQEFVVQDNPLPLWCGEVLVTRRQVKQQDGRVAFCGSPGSGKSSLIGVLLTGILDDGAGSARQYLFNHKHEVVTGRTSSIATRVLPIGDAKIEEMPFTYHPENFGRSSRSITMIDLGGGVTKQMLFGLMSRLPDFIGICISVEQPVEEVVRYVQVCRAMRLFFFVVVTKLDTVLDFEYDAFLLELAAQLSTVGCSSVVLGSVSEVDEFQAKPTRSNQVPVFSVSSVTNIGIDMFQHFITSLSPREVPLSPDSRFEVLLEGCFFVKDVGPVVRGYVAQGSVELGCHCKIGPDGQGNFYPVIIKGIHVDGSHVTRVRQTDEATFALSDLPKDVDMSQKGKMLISKSVRVCWEFVGRMNVISQDMTQQLQPILYTGNIRQAVKIVHSSEMDPFVLEEVKPMRFRFLYHPEVLREGVSIILQWSPNGIAVGEVLSIC
ncbi:Elongation factor Tu GTP binding domain [Trypanosoma vivax]|uniref:Putative GTP-binding protein n=1 Tax=Trypanosoma vivax (strain Y486) TaxID=1055687 RepID=G0TU99_TRYVY|nr:putative GTP-binding protein [Trypanosoma vivax]KAH8607424.1 Elongation factor Tu GTP binding domain [Trypanosoma vivax]CCC47533.1 putative GTP-binding protein [Trypanosoma vivax Y486]